MALGLNLSANAGGANFLPIVKFDARSGRIFRRDRANGENTDVDITKSFKAVFDFENIEVGWIDFNTGGAPHFAMAPHGEITPEKPTEAHKEGIRCVVKLAPSCGGDIREIASNAKAFLRGIEQLHDDYVAGAKKNPGKLPVVELADTVAITSGEGARKSTNYSPVFEITGWVKRPEGMNDHGHAATPAATERAAPPATGSSRVSAPAKKEVADDEDFG
jgi:hypothetical protein